MDSYVSHAAYVTFWERLRITILNASHLLRICLVSTIMHVVQSSEFIFKIINDSLSCEYRWIHTKIDII